MGETALKHDLQALLEHSSWVRELSRRLASGSAADDLEQATWLAALRRGAERRGPAREWLATIARNFARQERRSSGRRSEHEARAAREEALPSTVELLARVELQRKLVGAVMQLDEPYRTAVLLRYFENLPPREIAERLRVPVSTVRTRVARGLDRLRERLDREHGGRRELWIAAFAPLWPEPAPLSFGLGALLVVNAKIVVACAVLVAVGALSWWMTGRTQPAAQESESSSVAAPRPASSSSGAGARAREAEEAPTESTRSDTPRSAPASAATRSSEAPVVPLASARITGRVVDATGQGVEGVRIVAHSTDDKPAAASSESYSAAGGEFVFDGGPERGVLRVDARNWVTLLSVSFSAAARENLALVAAPRVELAGIVSDERGVPIEGVQLELTLPDDLRARLGVVLDRAETQRWVASSGADGAFAFDGAPQLAGARLTARAEGFLEWRAAAPEHTDTALEITLARPRAADGFVRGVVLDAASQPIGGAYVALGIDAQRTDENGEFAFQLDDPQSFGRRVGAKANKLTALAPGLALASFEPPLENGEPAWPSFVRLVLAQPSLALSGRVEDAKGDPVAGVRVYVSDPTLFGAIGRSPATVESLFAPGEGGWRYVESDARGEFELTGLLDREYVVRAHDSRTLLRVDSEPVRAGTRRVVQKLPTDRLYPRVAGRVLSKGGRPIAGAEIFAMCDALSIKYSGRPISTHHDALEPVATDAEGRFELKNVPMSLAYLRVNGANILPLEYGRYVEGDPRFANVSVRELPRESIESLEIRVDARCHMQVELGVRDLADELAVLDERGTPLELSLFEASARREGPRQPLHDGRSAMLSVPESGRTLVLFKGGVEVARSAIELDPSEPTTIRR